MRVTREDLLALDPDQFEKLVGGLLDAVGFENVLAFGGSGDEGVDLRAEWMEPLPTGGSRHTTWAVQCKRYTKPISEPELRQILLATLEPPADLFPRHPAFFLIAASSGLSIAAYKALSRANESPAKYGCHFLVWDGDRILDLVNDSASLIEKFFQVVATPVQPVEDIMRMQVVLDQFEGQALLTFTLETDRCVMGKTRLPAEELDGLVSAFRRLPSWSGRGQDLGPELLALGSQLFDIIPGNIQDVLRTSTKAIRLTSNVHILPFELALDGTSNQFLVSNHSIGRVHFTDVPSQEADWQAFDVIYISPIYVAPLPILSVEQPSALFEDLPPSASLQSAIGPRATIGSVSRLLGTLKNAPRIIHFTGHGVTTESSDVGLLLSDGMVRATDILGRVPASSLVFINACSSGNAFEKLGRDLRRASNSTLVGFVGPVTEEGGALIAIEFYRHVLAGKPFGEAVRCAREAQRVATPEDASWMSLVLFGDPLACITTKR